MDALTLATSHYTAHTPETGQINLAVKLIRSQQLALSAVSDLLSDRDRFPENLEPEAMASLIDTMIHVIAGQLDIIAENSEAIDAKARRLEKMGEHNHG